MERRQLRLLAVLAAVLLALTGVLYFGEPPGDADEVDTFEVVPEIDLAKATSMSLIQSMGDRNATLELTKRDGVWNVDAPFQASADPDTVVEMLDAVRESHRGIPIEGDPAEYGLEPPNATLTVGMDDGSTRVLVVGNVAPDGTRTYVRAMDGTIAAVPGTPNEPLLKRANEYRDHRVFRYEPGDVRRISIASDLGTLEATKTDGGWFLTGFSRVDLDKLDNWVVDFLNVRVDLFLDLEAKRPDEPRYVVEVETESGVQRMYVGRDTPYGPLVFFGEEGLNGTMDPGLLQMLERGPTDVGVAGAFPFDDSVTEVRLSGARTLTITKSGDTWVGADDAEDIVGILQLSQLTYKREPPAWAGPELTVEIIGQATHRIAVGPPDAEGFRAVRDTAGGSPVRVPIDELERLF